MKSIFVIAMNTFREIIRDRVLFSILGFAVLLIGVSVALGQLTFTESARLSLNFGLTAIHIGVAVLSVFVGSTLVSKEIEKQTILTLLVRPISRTQFLLGKVIGLQLVNLVLILGLAACLTVVLSPLGFSPSGTFALAVYGIFIEAVVLTSAVVMFGTFAKPLTSVVLGAGLFLVSHWVGSLQFFMSKSDSTTFRGVGRLILTVIPDLEALNWRSAPVYAKTIPATEVLQATAYSSVWVVVFMLLASVFFRRRDFV